MGTCRDCVYRHLEDSYSVCWAQKNAPYVSVDGTCDRYKDVMPDSVEDDAMGMTLGKAVDLIFERYGYNETLEFVDKPISYTLYEVWQIVDAEEKERERAKKNEV